MIAIYEPLYAPSQILTDPAFLPLRISNNDNGAWREFRILIDMFRSGIPRMHLFTGLFSPKFQLKTGKTGQEFIEFVKMNADADVCIINPFPQLAYMSFNAWMHGDIFHPGLLERAQNLLNKSGVAWTLDTVGRQGPDVLCYCNFWVGTEKFWNDYVGKVLVPIAEFLEREPDSEASRAVLRETRHTDPAPFLPFIIERLFSTYLTNTKNLVVKAYALDPIEACQDEFERELVRYSEALVKEADRRHKFSPELVQLLDLHCKLYRLYFLDHYSVVPYPFTGRTLHRL